jgi:hypothetical protein
MSVLGVLVLPVLLAGVGLVAVCSRYRGVPSPPPAADSPSVVDGKWDVQGPG